MSLRESVVHAEKGVGVRSGEFLGLLEESGAKVLKKDRALGEIR
jgi:hypothetical protein